jgi:tetratricopeptide (TPR) repeat protein
MWTIEASGFGLRWKGHMRRALAVGGLSVVCAVSLADPMVALNATRGEIARLPEYCSHVWGYFQDAQERAKWFVRMGPVFEHMHHYCWALVKANRAETPGVDPHLRRSLYASAVGECQYVLRNFPDPAFVLRPEIFYRMGQFEAANESWIQAIEYFEQSIGSKRDYWPPYIGIANIHLRLGRRDRAVTILRAGLDVTPEEPRLLEAMRLANDGKATLAGPAGRSRSP